MYEALSKNTDSHQNLKVSEVDSPFRAYVKCAILAARARDSCHQLDQEANTPCDSLQVSKNRA